MFVDAVVGDPIHRESHWQAVSSRTGASDRHSGGVIAQDEKAGLSLEWGPVQTKLAAVASVD